MAEKTSDRTEEVAEYYDGVGELVEVVGGNLHLGYWDDDQDDTPFLEAMSRLTWMVAERLALRPGERLLDVGCGVAEPAMRLVERLGISVSGITVSRWEVQQATADVARAGLSGKISISWADAAALPFSNEEFDAALAFDSVPNSPDKQKWFGEIFRVLRPGGRVVYSEYPAIADMTAAQREVLRANTVPDPPTSMDEAVAPAVSAGFEVLEGLDCSDRVRRFYTAFLQRFADQRADLSAAYGKDRIDAFESGITQMFELCREKIGYYLIVCRKPSGVGSTTI
ncbi:mycolic acid cyclopropane synthetase [Nocardia tenerifensis]|uniref:Mycolic acid cyclopropane synthetase n=1 Tax=Nocardia tenerifensis TaxID=228006 RepID=A0A318KCE2_9NOCA|nr:methyltransferase domain-containing protein [Nocardia tenerifensis]PXX70595.1 mycolic acid cyclopropane synthetase [Nocardia tenerifensis]